MLNESFFNRDAATVAKDLLGKVIRSRIDGKWLSAMVIETEAYYHSEKASHSSLGYTEKRKALFMPAGTIYMYYARGDDSLNISVKGEGNAVLIKSGVPYEDELTHKNMITIMQQLNPVKNSGRMRDPQKLCSGQTLLCRSLGLKVKNWDAKQFDRKRFYIEDVSYSPEKIMHATRLGIPEGRDGHLEYRFIDQAYVKFCTKKPVTSSRKMRSIYPGPH